MRIVVASARAIQAAQKTFGRIEGTDPEGTSRGETRCAHANSMIRKKLSKQGKVVDSPEVGQARHMEVGLTRLAILPLHEDSSGCSRPSIPLSRRGLCGRNSISRVPVAGNKPLRDLET